MGMKVFCPNCGTEMMVGNGAFAQPVTTEKNGNAFLVPKEIHNDNITKPGKTSDRLNALRLAGINIDKLQSLMQKDSDLRDIFVEDDPIIEEISKGGFIRNPELFRRWITAQTFYLLKDEHGWTHAVRRCYDTKYVLDQTKRELALLCELQRKCPNDIRFNFFTLDDLKRIFTELMNYNRVFGYAPDSRIEEWKDGFMNCKSLSELKLMTDNCRWRFDYRCTFKPKTWLNCFKGAGAYYTLQNIIRTHGLVIPKCRDMNESLDWVDRVFKSIIGYEPKYRRWDILMSVLVSAVKETGFELKY